MHANERSNVRMLAKCAALTIRHARAQVSWLRHALSQGRLWFSRNGVHTVTCTIPHEAVVFTIYGVMGPLVALGLIAAVIADCCRGTSRAKQE